MSGSTRERIPRHFDALCAPEPGKDAFHRVPFIPGEVRDAVERVLTSPGGRFRGRAAAVIGVWTFHPVLSSLLYCLVAVRRGPQQAVSVPPSVRLGCMSRNRTVAPARWRGWRIENCGKHWPFAEFHRKATEAVRGRYGGDAAGRAPLPRRHHTVGTPDTPRSTSNPGLN